MVVVAAAAALPNVLLSTKALAMGIFNLAAVVSVVVVIGHVNCVGFLANIFVL